MTVTFGHWSCLLSQESERQAARHILSDTIAEPLWIGVRGVPAPDGSLYEAMGFSKPLRELIKKYIRTDTPVEDTKAWKTKESE